MENIHKILEQTPEWMITTGPHPPFLYCAKSHIIRRDSVLQSVMLIMRHNIKRFKHKVHMSGRAFYSNATDSTKYQQYQQSPSSSASSSMLVTVPPVQYGGEDAGAKTSQICQYTHCTTTSMPTAWTEL